MPVPVTPPHSRERLEGLVPDPAYTYFPNVHTRRRGYSTAMACSHDSKRRKRRQEQAVTQQPSTLTPQMLTGIDAYWRAANYLSVGQMYLCDNPLLKRALLPSDVKSMLLGHWGTTPGQNFVYAHLNRVINQYDLNMIYVSGPGNGGPALVANTYLEGTYSEI